MLISVQIDLFLVQIDSTGQLIISSTHRPLHSTNISTLQNFRFWYSSISLKGQFTNFWADAMYTSRSRWMIHCLLEPFLGAKLLYESLCRSVRQSVRPSVSPSVSLTHFQNFSGSTYPMKLKFSGNEPLYILRWSEKKSWNWVSSSQLNSISKSWFSTIFMVKFEGEDNI